MQSSKEIFREFCKKEKDLPLFLTYDWLETVAPGAWDVIIEFKGTQIAGVLPYTYVKKKGLKLIELPPITPYGGIWLHYPNHIKNNNILHYEKEVMTSLIEGFCDYDQLTLKLFPRVTNWLPFYWKAFQQTTYYTYVLDDLKNHDVLFENFDKDARRRILKLQNEIHVVSSDDINILYNLKQYSYKNQNLKNPVTQDYIKKIHQFCKSQNCGELLIAKDDSGNIAAACLFVWDKNSCYTIYNASNPNYKKSGAMTLLLWEGIKKYSDRVNCFNMAGSMDPDIEKYLRNFGTKQYPYFLIKKTNSKLLKIKDFLSNFF